uniref:1-acylglycerol-3-phosphate O-acyltransferase n=1 Tax=Arundo donax TaxID=35708 RepID=A0A0A9GN58_ARUDO
MDGSSSSGSEGHHINGNQNQVQTIDPPDPSIVKNGPRHRPLTPMRRCRGVLCLVIMLLTAFMMMVYLSLITTFVVRLFSVHYSRKSTCFLFGMWLAMWPFLFEKINKTRFIFSGESVPPKERVLLFANHRTEVDWMYLWDFALRKGRLQCIKYILKKSLMKLPVFSWAFHIIEFIPVERKWEIDEAIIRSRLSELKNPKDPLWLAIFPEGTDYTEKKCIKSQEYAAEHGLPVLKNVLLPKTKGFNCCLQELRSSINAVYDITIAYKHRLPTFLDTVYGIDPSEVHIHIESIQVSDISTSEHEVADWLIERFRLKDKLLSDFSTLGHFPNEGTEGDLSTLKCLANFTTVVSVTSILMYITLFSSVWFKVFVAFSCTFLTFATYYSIHLPQLIGSPKASIHAKKA